MKNILLFSSFMALVPFCQANEIDQPMATLIQKPTFITLRDKVKIKRTCPTHCSVTVTTSNDRILLINERCKPLSIDSPIDVYATIFTLQPNKAGTCYLVVTYKNNVNDNVYKTEILPYCVTARNVLRPLKQVAV